MSNHSTADLHGYLQAAKMLARRAGRLIRQHRYPGDPKGTAGLAIDAKSGSADLVTSADLASQHLIFETLRSIYPTHLLIGEEDAQHSELSDAATWVVDAIDGTTNFVHGLSEVCVSIALCVNRAPIVAAVYNPMRNEMFHAAQGCGAYLDDVPIRCGDCAALADALVLTEWGYVREAGAVRKILAANERLISHNVRAVRQLGAGALDLCYVAAGRADAVYCGVAGEGWKMWDFAAGVLVAREAGAVVTALDGGKFDLATPSMACSSTALLGALLDIVNDNDKRHAHF